MQLIREENKPGLVEQLEERRMLAAQIATLVTGGPVTNSAPGGVILTVDPYGSFGDDNPASQAIFNPPNRDFPRNAVGKSGLYFGPLGNFLSEDTSLTEGSALPNTITFDSQTTTSATSHFTILGSDGITYQITLTQVLTPFDNQSQRATLTQTYTIKNVSNVAATNVLLARYLSSDENWNTDANFDDDFGGTSGDGRILVAFDQKTAGTPFVQIRDTTTYPATGYTGSPEGDPNITPAYTVQDESGYSDFMIPSFAATLFGGLGGGGLGGGGGGLGGIIAANGGILIPDLNTFPGDTDTNPPDGLDNRGENTGGQESLVMQNSYGTIAAGASITFSTSTDFGVLRDSQRNDIDMGSYVAAGTFNVDATDAVRPIFTPTATGQAVTITVTRGSGSFGSADIAVATTELDARAYSLSVVGGAMQFTPLDFTPLGASMSGLFDANGNVIPNDTNGHGIPSGITFLHFPDGVTKETLTVNILPTLKIEGAVDFDVFLFGSFKFPNEDVSTTLEDAIFDSSGSNFGFNFGQLFPTPPIPNQFPPSVMPLEAGEVPYGTVLDYTQPNAMPQFWFERQHLIHEPPGSTFTTIHIAPSGDAGSVHFDQATQSENDNAHLLNVQVDRDIVPDLSAQISFTYTVTGSAVYNQDYTIGTNADFTFDPVTGIGTGRFDIGAATAFIPVTILTDLSASDKRTLNFTITTAAPATIGTPPTDAITINDTVSAGSFQFTNGSFNVSEKDPSGVGTLTIQRIGGSSGAVTIPYTLVPGSALQNVNYTGAGGTVTFLDGQTQATISVPVLDDGVVTLGTSLTVSLGAPSDGTLGSPSSATLTINDADATSQINLGGGGGSGSGSGGSGGSGGVGLGSFTAREDAGSAVITVTRSGDLSQPATVDYATSAGTAAPNFNYVDTHGTLHFAAGAASASFAIQVLDDGIIDTPGTVNITLSNATGSSEVTDGTGVLTITNADSTFQFAPAGYVVNENDGTITLTVSRDGDTTEAASVNFGTFNESAISGTRYVAASGTLNFNPGETSKTFSVQLIDNINQIDPPEDFGVSLSAPTGNGARVSVPATAEVTVNDVDRSKPMISGVSIAAPSGNLERVILKFTKPLTASTATTTANYKIFVADKNGRFTKQVRVSAALYNASNQTVTLLPLPRIVPNTTIQVVVRGPGGVMDTSGRFLTSSVAGTPGNFTARIAFGNKISYTDRNGDKVSLSLTGKRKGTMVYTATTNPVSESLQLINAAGDTLSGTVTTVADGVAEFNSVTGARGVIIKLPRSHFKLDRVTQ